MTPIMAFITCCSLVSFVCILGILEIARRRINFLEQRFIQLDENTNERLLIITDTALNIHEALKIHAECIKHLMDGFRPKSATPSTNGCCPKDHGDA